jgi:hypothetical protein
MVTSRTENCTSVVSVEQQRAFDLVGLRRTSDVRLLREGTYPPLRGTLAQIDGRSFLYSTWFLPYLGNYPHGHVPAPIEIIDHQGDSVLAGSSRRYWRSPS